MRALYDIILADDYLGLKLTSKIHSNSLMNVSRMTGWRHNILYLRMNCYRLNEFYYLMSSPRRLPLVISLREEGEMAVALEPANFRRHYEYNPSWSKVTTSYHSVGAISTAVVTVMINRYESPNISIVMLTTRGCFPRLMMNFVHFQYLSYKSIRLGIPSHSHVQTIRPKSYPLFSISCHA